MQIMEGRLWRLKSVLEGYARSGGVELLGWDGARHITGEKGDDPGLYYFVPKMMRVFDLPLESAVNLFLGLLLAIPFAVGLVCLVKLADRKKLPIVLIPYMLLFFTAFMSWDVYIASASVVVGLVPLVILMMKGSPTFPVFILIGQILGFFNFIRGHSGTSVGIFITAIILFSSLKRRYLLIASLIGGCLLVNIPMAEVFRKRNALLIPEVQTNEAHPIWHSMYIGTSFLNNDYDLPVTDQDVKKKVGLQYVTFSKEYEARVKPLVIRTILDHPYFILRSLFAKLGVMLMYVFFFGNVGLFMRKRLGPIEKSFLLAGGFSLVPGLLVNPYHFYCLGLMAFSTLYGGLNFNENF